MSEEPWSVEEWHADTPGAAPSVPPAPRRRRWVVPVIVVSSLVVVSLVVVSILGLVSLVTGALSASGPDQPLVEGESGSPVATSPLDCPQACFSSDSIDATLPGESAFAALGVADNTFPNGTYEPVAAGELHRRDATSWKSYDGTPDACFFAPTSAPYASSLDTPAEESPDAVYFTGTHEDTDLLNSLDQAVRVFADSASAESYLADLARNIGDCEVIEIGPPNDRYSAEIFPAPALDLPETIAGVGWIRVGDPGIRWRAYTFDLQRGNLVIRTRLLTDGSITEQEFRSFVEEYSEQVAALEPAPAPAG
jgi:hypothetical protein